MGNGVEINKRRLRFSCLRQGTTFVLFQAISQSVQKYMFWIALPAGRLRWFPARPAGGVSWRNKK